MSTGEGLVALGLVVAATTLIVTGHGFWVVGIVVIGMSLLS